MAPLQSSAASAAIVVQITKAPVKIPDFVPVFAPSRPDVNQDSGSEKAKQFKVLLFNDNVNLREFVARVLVSSIPDYSQSDAYMVMQQAHKVGMAVVGIWAMERAEDYCNQLKAGGLIATVTAADDD